jgi:hypothetical protein
VSVDPETDGSIKFYEVRGPGEPIPWTRSTDRRPIPRVFQSKNKSKKLEKSLAAVFFYKNTPKLFQNYIFTLEILH